MDKLISEILGFFLVAVLMFLLFIFGALYYHVQQYNQFKNQCIEVVQRTGEMNSSTQSYLNDIAKRYYAGYGGSSNPDFKVQQDGNASRSQGYGNPVQFYIVPKVSVTISQAQGSMFGFERGQHIKPGKRLIRVDSQVRNQGNKETHMAR